MVKENTIQWLKDNNISEVECIFSDFTGSAKGKIIPAFKYYKEKSFNIPEFIFFQTVTGNSPDDLKGIIEDTESDMKLIPDLSTISLIPWANEPTVGIIHDCLKLDGSDVSISPRNVLKKVLKAYSKRNWSPIIAPEVEFYLTNIESSPNNPLNPPTTRFKRPEIGGNAYSMDALNDFDPFLETLYSFCEDQNIEIDTLNHEYGTAQLEVNFPYGDALDLADIVFKFKRTCRESAIRHNVYATFMAKPLEDQPGSAMHFHQNIIDDNNGKNIFIDSNNKHNDNFFHFIGGIQKYIRSILIFFAPNVNSYRRLIPDWAAPTNVDWGYDNRTIGLRIPNSTPQNTRIENRIPGADTNPYLIIAASLAAGLAGIDEKIKPRNPINIENYKIKSDFPLTLQEAISELDKLNIVHKLLGEDFVKAFQIIKECELADYSKVISSWERKYLLLSV